MKHKFKVGDVIEPIIPTQGFEKAEVLSIKDEKYYLKIMNGTAIVSQKVENNYRIKEPPKIKSLKSKENKRK